MLSSTVRRCSSASAQSASEADPATLAGVVIPGGWAPDRLRMDDGVLKLVQALFEQNSVVAAICHAGSSGTC